MMLLVIIAALLELVEGAFRFMDRHRLAEYTAQIHQELIHRVSWSHPVRLVTRSSILGVPQVPSKKLTHPRKLMANQEYLNQALHLGVEARYDLIWSRVSELAPAPTLAEIHYPGWRMCVTVY